MKNLNHQSARVFLKRGRSTSVSNRHPWLFSGAIERVQGDFEPGDIVAVYSHDNRFLAKGFINPQSQIRVRLLTFRDEAINRQFWEEKIRHALNLRQAVITNRTSAYRLIHSDGDFLSGLIVDRYNKVLVVQFNSLGMAKVKPLIVEILADFLKPEAILERSEAQALQEEGLKPVKQPLFGTPPDRVEIEENGFKFLVDILEGQKTGFFLDQRENRRLIGDLAAGKRLLNCFSYTGGFSIYAAAAGAETTSVDNNKGAILGAKENFLLNGLDPKGHQFEVANVFDYLRKMDQRYDIIILDPPAFVKHRKHLNQGARGYKDITRLALMQVHPGGLVLTCSCSSYISWDLFRKIVFSAAREAGREVQIIARPGQPADHPINVYHLEGEYLKTFLLRVIE